MSGQSHELVLRLLKHVTKPFVAPVIPIITLGSVGAPFVLGGAPDLVVNSCSIADSAHPNMTGCTITITGNFNALDVLAFTNQLGITGVYAAPTLTLTGTTTQANYQTAIATITFSTTAANTNNRTITYQLNNGANLGNSLSVGQIVVPAPPTLSVTTATATFNQLGVAVAPASACTITDSFFANMQGASISITAGFKAGDLLNFTNQNGITGIYNAGTGVLLLSGVATKAQYQTAIVSVTFSTSDTTSNTTRTLSYTATNPGPATSATQTVNVLIQTAPILTAAGIGNVFTIGGVAVSIIFGSDVISDPANANMASATVKVLGNFVVGDVLNFTNQNGITGVYTAGTGVLALSGSATKGNYQTALASVSFTTTVAGTTPRTISLQVNNGTLNGNVVTATVGVATGASLITINPGDNVATKVSSAPSPSIFTFNDGLYRGATCSPRNNDVFKAANPGKAILNGSRIATGWAGPVSGLWSITGQAGGSGSQGNGYSGWDGNFHPEMMFRNGTWIKRVTTSVLCVPGTWFWDTTAHIIYVADDPTAATIEIGNTTQAFSANGDGVTIQDLVVEKYANLAQVAAVDRQGTNNGLVQNMEIRYNHGVGIRHGHNTRITTCNIHHNGQLGYGGSTLTNPHMDHCEIAWNNMCAFSDGWEAGGGKHASACAGVNVQYCYSHDNNGPGFWTDWQNTNTYYGYNYARDNNNSGIFHEASQVATIEFNTAVNNGEGYQVFLWNSQILSSTSDHSTVTNNICETIGGANGLGIIYQNRDPSFPVVESNRFNHNTIIHQTNGGTSGITADFDTANFYANGDNLFDFNTYHVPNIGFSRWQFQGNRDFAGFKSFGQEPNGTADTTIPFSAYPTPTDCGPSWMVSSPLAIAGCVLWLDGRDYRNVTLNAGNVSQWSDKSSGANHFTQVTAGFQPAYNAFAWTLQPTDQKAWRMPFIRFDGNDDVLTGPVAMASALLNSTTKTSFYVFDWHTFTNFKGAASISDNGGTPAWGITLDVAPSIQYRYRTGGGNSSFDGSNMVVDKVVVVSMVQNGANLNVFLNGVADGSAADAGATTTVTAPALGANQPANGWSNADLCEVIHYSTNLSTTDRQRIENYLMNKWLFPTVQG